MFGFPLELRVDEKSAVGQPIYNYNFPNPLIPGHRGHIGENNEAGPARLIRPRFSIWISYHSQHQAVWQ